MYLLEVIFLFLPAGIANMIPPFAAIWFPQFNQPLDFNQKVNGVRVFGDHKTIRGLLIGVLFSWLVFLLQKYLFQSSEIIKGISLIDYSSTTSLLGVMMGLGALLGDALKSFIKRQIRIPPGTSWFPWDQIDWVIGSILLSAIYIPITLSLSVAYLVSGLALHLIFKSIGFFIKMNNSYI